LLLPQDILDRCDELIEEHMRVDLLRSYGLEPRNKILLIGPPGNGKTSLAEAIAEALMFPLLTVKYESLIGAYLGETASHLGKLFDYVKTRECVLFFDELKQLPKNAETYMKLVK
jgi:SpoVK/Ycf46/Vps4 family AAA+-type ATPase